MTKADILSDQERTQSCLGLDSIVYHILHLSRRFHLLCSCPSCGAPPRSGEFPAASDADHASARCDQSPRTLGGGARQSAAPLYDVHCSCECTMRVSDRSLLLRRSHGAADCSAARLLSLLSEFDCMRLESNRWGGVASVGQTFRRPSAGDHTLIITLELAGTEAASQPCCRAMSGCSALRE